MLKSLDIDLYLDGFSFDQLNCVDVPIAGATGYFNYDNYYYYSFYYCLYNNWSEVTTSDFFKYRNQILANIGLGVKTHEVKSCSEFIDKAKDCIDKSIPIVLILKYMFMFYTIEYMSSYNLNHGVLVTGYNTDNSTLLIRDPKVVDRLVNQAIEKKIKAEPLYKLQLPEEFLTNMWAKSNECHVKENNIFSNIFFTIEKTCEPRIKSYDDILEDLLNNYDFTQNKLIKFVENFNEFLINNRKTSFLGYRRNFQNTFVSFFHVVEKALNIEELEQHQKDLFFKTKSSFVNQRNALISKLNAIALRGLFLEDNAAVDIIKDIKSKEADLLEVIRSLYKNSKGFKKTESVEINTELINYAKSAKISADSELVDYGIHSKAENAINGKSDVWQTDMWSSGAKSNTHWLKLDFGEPKTIYKIIVKHMDLVDFVTTDFKIQGSLDGRRWTNLVNIKDNTKGVTVCEIKPTPYKNVRIYITKPCLSESTARIYEFEAWGL